MNILITSAGQRVSLVKIFKKEIQKIFPEGRVFTTDFNPKLAPACMVSDQYFQICRVDSEDYLNQLLKICIENNIKLIIPTIDTELEKLSKAALDFKNKGIEIVVSNIEFIEKCRDKRKINSFFEDNNIEIPKQFDKSNLSFPLFIKPYDGSLSKDIFLINKSSELTYYHNNNHKLMFMEYINPKDYDEFTIDSYYDKNGVLKCCVPRKRIAVRAGEINKGVTQKNYIHDFLFEKLNKIEGVKGCLTIQVFYNKTDNRVVAIEINPRFGGGFPLSYFAGANFPKWIIEEYLLNKNIEEFTNWETNLLMLRYDDEVLISNYDE